MVAAPLVDRDIEDGKTLVEQLDTDGFPVTAALWYYRAEREKWYLIIATRLVREAGPLEAYQRLSKSIERVQESRKSGFALDSLRVELIKDKDELPRLLKRAVQTGPGIAGIRFAGNVINGVYIDDAYIYRVA